MPAAGELVLGLNAVTAVNSSGDSSAPVWEIVKEIKDETLNMETALSDVTTRAANGWRLQVGTLSEATVDGQMMYLAEPTAVGNQAKVIRDAYFAKSRLLMGFFDDDPAADDTTVSGLIGGFGVTNYSIGRQLEEAMIVDVTFTVRENDLNEGPAWSEIVNPDPGP